MNITKEIVLAFEIYFFCSSFWLSDVLHGLSTRLLKLQKVISNHSYLLSELGTKISLNIHYKLFTNATTTMLMANLGILVALLFQCKNQELKICVEGFP